MDNNNTNLLRETLINLVNDSSWGNDIPLFREDSEFKHESIVLELKRLFSKFKLLPGDQGRYASIGAHGIHVVAHVSDMDSITSLTYYPYGPVEASSPFELSVFAAKTESMNGYRRNVYRERNAPSIDIGVIMLADLWKLGLFTAAGFKDSIYSSTMFSV